jgi:hypothetical protein
MSKDASGKLPPVPKLPNVPRINPKIKPIPTPEGFMTTAAKMSLKVVHYKAELETSPELDAVTEQVIAEIQGLQAAARKAGPQSRPPPADRQQLEIELIESLKVMLGRIFRAGKLATTIERKLGEVSKRFARVFFESELHEKLGGKSDEAKAMRYAEQALYHAFARTEKQLLEALLSYQYASPKVLEQAKGRFQDYVKELRNGFLARTTPELNTLVKYLNESLTLFFTQELPPMLGELAWEVVKDARLAEARTTAGYKISASSFGKFRQAFERRFLQRLVPWVEDEMLKRVRASKDQPFRDETVQLVADPHIFSDVCEVVCDAVYDNLYNDGFLDLPSDWRRRLAHPTTP